MRLLAATGNIALAIAVWDGAHELAGLFDCVDQLDRQLIRGNARPLGDDHGPLDDILQLPDVTGPGVSFEDFKGIVVNLVDGLAGAAGVHLEKVHGQLGNVLAPLPERRHGDRDDIEAVIEVFAELGFRDQTFEILVCRGDEAHIDLDRFAGANALERHLLKNAQKLGLNFEADVANLVEKKRAAIGHLEAADLIAMGASKCSLDVAE